MLAVLTNSLGRCYEAILDAEFGAEKSMLTTVCQLHTASQPSQDAPKKDLKKRKAVMLLKTLCLLALGRFTAVPPTCRQLKRQVHSGPQHPKYPPQLFRLAMLQHCLAVQHHGRRALTKPLKSR